MTIEQVSCYFWEEYQRLLKSGEPDCAAWWAQQPIDLVADLVEDVGAYFDENVNDPRACLFVAKSALSDMALMIQRHGHIKRSVEAEEIMGDPTLIHWRLKPPSPEKSTESVTIRRTLSALEKKWRNPKN